MTIKIQYSQFTSHKFFFALNLQRKKSDRMVIVDF